VNLLNQKGMLVRHDCIAFFSQLRSTADNGLVQVNATDGAATNGTATGLAATTQRQGNDTDFEINELVQLLFTTAFPESGTWAFSSFAGDVVTGVYYSSVAVATAQGDCVFVATANND
jgi:hypothetical protein